MPAGVPTRRRDKRPSESDREGPCGLQALATPPLHASGGAASAAPGTSPVRDPDRNLARAGAGCSPLPGPLPTPDARGAADASCRSRRPDSRPIGTASDHAGLVPKGPATVPPGVGRPFRRAGTLAAVDGGRPSLARPAGSARFIATGAAVRAAPANPHPLDAASPCRRRSRPPAWPWPLLALGLCVALVVDARATTLAPIAFEELVGRAERILVTEVVDVSARPDPSRPGLIVTRVTFRVTQVLKGPPTTVVALDLLGGTLGEASLNVPGLPRFRPGDRDVLFVKPGGQHVSPLVGFAHGRVRIAYDPRAGIARVARFDGRPLGDLRDFSEPHPRRSAQPARAMTLDRFLAEVIREAQAQEAAR